MSSQNNNTSEGFKMTELGLLPEEWRLTKLGEICSITTGKKDVDQGNPEGQYPFFSCAQRIYRSDTYSFDCEAILIAGNGDVGSVKYYKGKFEAYQRTYVLYNCSQSTDYLYSYLYGNVKKELVLKKSGSTMPYIRKGDLINFVLPIPPLPEQKAIARVLSTTQKAIETQDKIIATARELKKSLMRHLFTYGPVQVADAEKVPLKETEIGLVPENWGVVKLGEYCDFTTGKLNSNQAVLSGKYPFFTCSQETFRIDRYSFDCEAVLLSGNNARGIYSVKYYNGKFDAYQRTYVITIRDTNSLSYLYLKNVLETKLEELRIGSIGTSTKFLTLKMLLNLQIPKPPVEQQHEFARMLSGIDNKIEVEEDRRTSLQTLFKTMLHHLMTGKVRVKEFSPS